jgi:hypothetical protein
MRYSTLKKTGALQEGSAAEPTRVAARGTGVAWAPGGVSDYVGDDIPPSVLNVVPAWVARQNLVVPVAFDGETVTCLTTNVDDLILHDRLRALLAKNVRLLSATERQIRELLARYYRDMARQAGSLALLNAYDTLAEDLDDEDSGVSLVDPVDSGLSDALDEEPSSEPAALPAPRAYVGVTRRRAVALSGPSLARPNVDHTTRIGGTGMFHYIVEEGQRVLVRHPDGSMEVVAGPKRVWRFRNAFQVMAHYVAHPGEFLIVRFRDGRQEHLPGPTEIWFDPRVHEDIAREDALQLAAKEAVVVYSRPEGAERISRRIVYGPELFVLKPGEWLHTFSWHASKGGSQGVEKVANALVFQKLWLMPDQMYHDVHDVRTADDAVLTIRLMMFFELTDIERMLDTTHDPIGDFVNAATSDVVDFTGRHDFESFKRNTDKLNELDTYKQLTTRAEQSGYRINKVVYRGYGAPQSLQAMHDQAIEARTKLELERATEQQAQNLENYKLDCQLARAGKRRTEQASEVEHDLQLAKRRQEAEIEKQESQRAFLMRQKRAETDFRIEARQREDAQQRDHLAALRDLGVDLTAYLTQARADRVIELRGAAGTHVHLDQLAGGQAKGEA